MGIAPLTDDDASRVTLTEVVSRAFDADPLWTWALPDATGGRAQRARFWSIVVGGALRYPWTFASPDSTAVALWIPPGAEEWDEAGERELAHLMAGVPSLAARRLRFVLESLARHHPDQGDHGEPLAYLSVLAVTPEHHGEGRGGALFDATLDRIDAAGWASYLESSNPRNLPFYERRGFERRISLDVLDGPAICTMMRPGR